MMTFRIISLVQTLPIGPDAMTSRTPASAICNDPALTLSAVPWCCVRWMRTGMLVGPGAECSYRQAV